MDLAPALTEVTVFAGCPHLDPKKTLADQVKLAETVILSFGMFVLKELCHHISVFLVTEAGWGSQLSNQVRGRCGFVTS